MGIDLELLQAIGPMLFRGLKVTMEIAVIGILFGFVLGSLCGYALQSRNKIAKGIANIYVWIMRGTPIVVQALYVYFVVPEIIGLIKGERVVLDPTFGRYPCYHIKCRCIYITACAGSTGQRGYWTEGSRSVAWLKSDADYDTYYNSTGISFYYPEFV